MCVFSVERGGERACGEKSETGRVKFPSILLALAHEEPIAIFVLAPRRRKLREALAFSTTASGYLNCLDRPQVG